MITIIFHSHFVHVTFVSFRIFRTFDRMIFGRLNFLGTRRYVVTVRDPQMVRDQKKIKNRTTALECRPSV